MTGSSGPSSSRVHGDYAALLLLLLLILIKDDGSFEQTTMVDRLLREGRRAIKLIMSEDGQFVVFVC